MVMFPDRPRMRTTEGVTGVRKRKPRFLGSLRKKMMGFRRQQSKRRDIRSQESFMSMDRTTCAPNPLASSRRFTFRRESRATLSERRKTEDGSRPRVRSLNRADSSVPVDHFRSKRFTFTKRNFTELVFSDAETISPPERSRYSPWDYTKHRALSTIQEESEDDVSPWHAALFTCAPLTCDLEQPPPAPLVV